MRIQYQTWIDGKHEDIIIDEPSPEMSIYQAFTILAERTVERPVPEVLIYGSDGKLAFTVRANEYSDGQQDYIVTPQKEELYG